MKIVNKLLEWLKYFLFLIITIVVYEYLQPLVLLPFMSKLGTMPNILKSLLLISSEILVFIVLAIIYHKLIIANLKEFFKHPLKNIGPGLLCWIIGITGMIICNILITFVMGAGLSDNEEVNREIITKLPLYAIPAIAIFGPLVEEMVFRLSFRKVIPNKTLFIIITSIIFASVHLIASFNSFSEILLNFQELFHFFPYFCLALAFGFAYRKTDNICTTMFIHMLHNTYCLFIILLGMIVS